MNSVLNDVKRRLDGKSGKHIVNLVFHDVLRNKIEVTTIVPPISTTITPSPKISLTTLAENRK
jgi:hypothetical protein